MQTAAYLIKQLTDFREDHRQNDGGMMNGGAANQFSPEKLREAALYYSQQPPPVPAVGDAPPEILARGRTIFENGLPPANVPACKSCHDADTAASTGRPLLEAQHARYLQKQLREFRSGTRKNDPDGAMRGIARALSDADIRAVAVFLSQTPRRAK